MRRRRAVRLTGANGAYIRQQLPHIGDLLTDDVDEVLDHGEVLIVGTREPRVVDAIARQVDRFVVDLVRLPDAGTLRGTPNYQGIGWSERASKVL